MQTLIRHLVRLTASTKLSLHEPLKIGPPAFSFPDSYNPMPHLQIGTLASTGNVRYNLFQETGSKFQNVIA